MTGSKKTTASLMGLAASLVIAMAMPGPAHAQQDAGQAQQIAATTAKFETACSKLAYLYVHGQPLRFTWMGLDSHIQNLEGAVRVRKAVLMTRRNDELSATIQNVQSTLTSLERAQPTSSWDRTIVPKIECARDYLALVKAVDAPSWEIARAELAQESAAVIGQKTQALQAQQQAQDAAAAEKARQQKEATMAAAQWAAQQQVAQDAADAETARQQKEAAIAAAHAEAVAAQRAAQQQADAETRAKEESFAREAAAKAGKELADAQRREAEKLPGCADDQVLQMVKDAVAASPAGHVLGLRVVDIENPRETGVGGSTPKRSCFAELMTTAGRNWGPYTLSWASGGEDRVLIEVQLSN